MNKPKQYIVYTQRGEYHHGYNGSLDGALDWAIDCAKTVRGSVKEIWTNGREVEVFNCHKKNHVHAN